MSNYKYYVNILTKDLPLNNKYEECINFENELDYMKIFGNAYDDVITVIDRNKEVVFKRDDGINSKLIAIKGKSQYFDENNILYEDYNMPLDFINDVAIKGKYCIIKEYTNDYKDYNFLFYFINDYRIINNTTIEYNLELDVITTYFKDFKKLNINNKLQTLQYHADRWTKDSKLNNLKCNSQEAFYKVSENINITKDKQEQIILHDDFKEHLLDYKDIYKIDENKYLIPLYVYYYKFSADLPIGSFYPLILLYDNGDVSVYNKTYLTLLNAKDNTEIVTRDTLISSVVIYRVLSGLKPKITNIFISQHKPNFILKDLVTSYKEEFTNGDFKINAKIYDDWNNVSLINTTSDIIENFSQIDYSPITFNFNINDEPKILLNENFTNFNLIENGNTLTFSLSEPYILNDNNLNISESISITASTSKNIYLNKYKKEFCPKMNINNNYGFNFIQSIFREKEAQEPGYFSKMQSNILNERIAQNNYMMMNNVRDFTRLYNETNIENRTNLKSGLKFNLINQALEKPFEISNTILNLKQLSYEKDNIASNFITGNIFSYYVEQFKTLNPILIKKTLNDNFKYLVLREFKKYGYKTNEYKTFNELFTRKLFNFIKLNISEMDIDGYYLPHNVLNKLINILNNGVRFWNVSENMFKLTDTVLNANYEKRLDHEQ